MKHREKKMCAEHFLMRCGLAVRLINYRVTAFRLDVDTRAVPPLRPQLVCSDAVPKQSP